MVSRKRPKLSIRKQNPEAPKKPNIIKSNKPEIELRHQRFDGFDIYTAAFHGQKLLFHKPINKTMKLADTFQYLGSNDNLWLCENIQTREIHIAPFDRFTQLNKEL